MAEQTLRNGDVGEPKPEPGKLEDAVDHWMKVIDRWVQRVDQEMGGRKIEDAGPGPEPDSASEAESEG